VPFCHSTFVVVRPIERRCERVRVLARTLGDRLRKRRWSLGLTAKDVARQLGVCLATYRNWELNGTAPDLRRLPKAIAFLGFDWRPEPGNFGDAVNRARTALGMSLEDLARLLHLDEGTLSDLEAGRHAPAGRTKSVVAQWLVSGG
jgi:transcriptional regulator with XRE-family HTH domain